MTTTIPPSFVNLQNPNQVQPSASLNALAIYYNTTLGLIGSRNFANASFLLTTFRFVNIPSSVNGTAQSANTDLAMVEGASANATTIFAKAGSEVQARQYINASLLVNRGCSLAEEANRTLADFEGPQTASFGAESVPVVLYSKGSSAASAEVGSLLAACSSLSGQSGSQNGSQPPILLIGSAEKEVETGGTIELNGNLTLKGVGVSGEVVLFYVNGSYFGSLETSMNGSVSGNLQVHYIYSHAATVQALVEANSTRGIAGAISNTLVFTILFNQTNLVIADPSAYLPGENFGVHGNLTTANGNPLSYAPVTVTFLHDSVAATTDSKGVFRAQFTVPNNATDGVYYIYARFTPKGVYGPSFNFTSIDVYHLRLTLVLSVPGLSFAGFSTHLSGTVSANGSSVANSSIDLVSPWGTSTAKTDSAGYFDATLPVSPLEFASSRYVTVTVIPTEPYIAASTAVVTLGLFNILVVILPVAIVGAAGYEAYSLGVFQDLKTRIRRRGEPKTALLGAMNGPSIESLPWTYTGPEPLRLLGRALDLASRRFSIAFRASQTIREMLALVREKEDSEAFVAFSRILTTAEDFLYSKRFDPSSIDNARKALASLEVLWS